MSYNVYPSRRVWSAYEIKAIKSITSSIIQHCTCIGSLPNKQNLQLQLYPSGLQRTVPTGDEHVVIPKVYSQNRVSHNGNYATHSIPTLKEEREKKAAICYLHAAMSGKESRAQFI